jgi:hypothetical protein
VATLDDYTAVRELILDLFDTAVQATVSETVRQTVVTVQQLHDERQQPVPLSELAKRLNLDKSTVSRRVKVAMSDGYLQNLETRRGQPMKLTTGDSLPEGVPLLPEPANLTTCCSVAMLREGADIPAPLSVVPTGKAGSDSWEF